MSFHFALSISLFALNTLLSKRIAHLLNQFGDIDKSAVLMVGDRDQDIAGARANGLCSAGALWGYGSFDELQNAGADYLISKPSELCELVIG